MNKIKCILHKVFSRSTLFLTALLLCIIIPSTQLSTHYKTTQSEAPGNPFDSIRLSPVFSNADDVLIQPFVPGSPHVKSIKIRLAFDSLDIAYDWILNLRLTSPSGKIIREQNISIANFGNYAHYRFDINRLLKPNCEYRLEIRQIAHGQKEGRWTQSFGVMLKDAAPAENLPATFNGVPVDGALDIIYDYAIWNLSFLFWILLPLVSVFLYFRFPSHRGLVLALLSPFVTLLLSEQLAGNLITLDLTALAGNLVIQSLAFFFLYFLTGKIRLSAFVTGFTVMFMALAQYFILRFRGKPISISDLLSLSTALSVAANYSYRISMDAAGCLFRWIMYMILLILHPVPVHKPRKAKMLALRIAGLAAVVAFSVSGLHAQKDLSRLNLWFINDTFMKNGILYMPYLETGYYFQSAPKGYSLKRVEQIAQQAPASSAGEGIVPENLIVIMNESLADLNCISEIHSDQPILPFIRSNTENTIRGWLHMPVFGAGTSTSEYEVLTGNSSLFMTPGVSAYQLNVSPPEYGMASTLKQMGYRRIALHPAKSINWNRSAVYPMMEFEKFYSIENWDDPSAVNIRNYVSDASAYHKLIKLTQEKQPGEKLFLFLVTMQNHGGYEFFPSYTPDVSLQHKEHYRYAETYMSLINESDKAYRELIEYYSSVEEPTLIVMFGDHQPKIEDAFYEELFGKPLDKLTLLENQKRYMAPYIIWANYPLKSQSGLDMSSNYLGSFTLQTANIPLSAYDRFLLNLQQKIPIIGQGMICDASGTWYDISDLPEAYQHLIDDYRILQYNRVYDRSNQIHRIFQPDPGQ
ncbi:MAG: sulfatase-like hydrolase/transferase [Clostridia bacterium]|nr:sulfatase-like hydrolase/transferase [Clostridia bacterium]